MNEGRIFSFARFRIDPANQELWRDSEIIAVRPKTFQILLYLAQNPQRLVSRQELLDSVWPGVAVSGNLLRAYVWELRKILGDTAKAPHYLETVNRRGYRFLPPVSIRHLADLNEADPRSDTAALFYSWPHAAAGSLENGASGDRGPAHRPAYEHHAAHGGIFRPSEPTLTVGVVHSLSGTMAYSESPVVDATLLAIDQINGRGGLLGRRVEPIVVDGKSDCATFARSAEWLLAEKKVCTIFGCWMSAHRKRVLPLVEQYDNVLIYPVQYEGMETSPNVFYTGAAPNQQIIPAIQWTFGFLNCKRLFLVGSDYIFPRVANEIVRDQMNRLGGTITGESYIPSGTFEVRNLVEAIAAAKPDLIVNTINGDSNIAFFRALHAAGITPDRIPTLSFSIGENELRNLDITGNYAAWNYFQSIERSENSRFVEAFRSHYGPQRVTSDPMEAAYLGVHLWAQAVVEAGSADIPQIREALRHQSFNAPEGPVHFDSVNQHTWKTIRVGKVLEDGQFEVIYSSERPIRPEPFPDTRSPREWTALLEGLNLSAV
jgi:urea transport system substrate-binding protein